MCGRKLQKNNIALVLGTRKNIANRSFDVAKLGGKQSIQKKTTPLSRRENEDDLVITEMPDNDKVEQKSSQESSEFSFRSKLQQSSNRLTTNLKTVTSPISTNSTNLTNNKTRLRTSNDNLRNILVQNTPLSTSSFNSKNSENPSNSMKPAFSPRKRNIQVSNPVEAL